MMTKRFIRTGGILLFLLLLFNFISPMAATRTTYFEEANLKDYINREAITRNDKTMGSGMIGEFSDHFNTETGNIVKIEYFFDTDPGYGNGIPLDFTPGSEIMIDEPIPVNSLEEGIHIFYIRVCDDEGNWSQTLNQIFLKTQLQSDSPYNITRVEYFFDTDPGFGNGSTAEFNSSSHIVVDNIWAEDFLDDGVHMLYVRAMDEFGQWSQTFQRLFLKTHLESDVLNVEEVEYFFDDDPGTGKGTKIEISPGERLTIDQVIPVEDLSDGLHRFNVRCRFSDNNWGQLYHRGFIKYSGYDIVKVEYYFDEDPGVGNATDLPVTPADMVIIDEVLPIQSLTSGSHTLNVRALSETDKWSDVFTATITVFGGVGIDDASVNRAFVSVYPNPTKGALTLEANSADTPLSFQLVSLSGAVLMNRKVLTESITTLDLSSYANGTYILRFWYKDEVRTQNIILSK